MNAITTCASIIVLVLLVGIAWLAALVRQAPYGVEDEGGFREVEP